MNGHEVKTWANVADFFMPTQDTEFYRRPHRAAGRCFLLP